jgi:putative transposase
MLIRKKALVDHRKKVQRITKRNGLGVRPLPMRFPPTVPASRSVSAFVNKRWATDMTHFFYKEGGWCQVLVLMDCWNRAIIGYWTSKRQDSKVADGALEDALIR